MTIFIPTYVIVSLSISAGLLLLAGFIQNCMDCERHNAINSEFYKKSKEYSSKVNKKYLPKRDKKGRFA